MGWPNNDPEGWAEIERSAVLTWLHRELMNFTGSEFTLEHALDWLQLERVDIFQAMVEQVPPNGLGDAEADYLERKFSTGEQL